MSVAIKQAEYQAAAQRRKDAEAAEKAAQIELYEAMIEEGAANPHPFACKKVRRVKMQRGGYEGWYNRRPDRKVTERGTVVMHDIAKYGSRYRNHMPKPGEWFVLSASGITAYSLNVGAWELDE